MLSLNQTNQENHENIYRNHGSENKLKSKVQPYSYNEKINSARDRRTESFEMKANTLPILTSNSFVFEKTSFSPLKTDLMSNSFTNTCNRANTYPFLQDLSPEKCSRTKTVINLTQVDDADIEEFTDKIETPSQFKLIYSYNPIPSSNRRSFIGVTDLNGSQLNGDVQELEDNKTLESLNSYEDVDESDLRPSEGLGDNHEIISNMTLIHNFNVRFQESRYRAESIKSKLRWDRSSILLCDQVVLEHLIKFLDCKGLINFSKVSYAIRNNNDYQSKIKKRLRELVLMGLDNHEQHFFWDSFINFKYLKIHHATAFTRNFVRDCRYIKDIKKDLDRTLPEYDKYSTEEGKDALFKVLVAISNTISDVGYIQGLNSIAGVFLFYLKEEEAFWATLYLLEKLIVKDLLKEDFQTIYKLNYQFECFFENYLPDIKRHLNFQAITLSYITTPWFITLFSYYLPLPKVIKLWNFFFLKGFAFLIQFGLAIFSLYKEEICKIEPDEVPTFLKYQLREISDDDDRLFERAQQFKVTKRLMEDLESYYVEGKPKVKLFKNEMGKWTWELENILLETEPFLNLQAPEKRFTDNFNKESFLTTQSMIGPTQDHQKTDQPGFKKFFTAITGIPETFRNIFSRKKEVVQEATDYKNEELIKTQEEKALNLTKAQAMERDSDSDGTVYLIETSPENTKEREQIPETGVNYYQYSYSYPEKVMSDSSQEIPSIARSTTYDQIRKIQYSNFTTDPRITSILPQDLMKKSQVTRDQDSPRQMSLRKFSEIAKSVGSPNNLLDQGFYPNTHLSKYDSPYNREQVEDIKHFSTITQETYNIKDPSVLYFSSNNQKFT